LRENERRFSRARSSKAQGGEFLLQVVINERVDDGVDIPFHHER
jgi:hypothetical protein